MHSEESVEIELQNEQQEAPEIIQTPEPSPEPYQGELIAEFAKQFEGYKYVYSGKSPEMGFDCSGLVYYVYKEFGYRLNRVAADQAKNGSHVDYLDLLPGDILCFSSGSYIGHVGLYLGDGKFIHAMDSANGVVITELDYWLESRNLEARRIIGVEQQLTPEEMRDAYNLEEEILEQKRQEDELKRLHEEEERRKREAEEREKLEDEMPSPSPTLDPNHIVIIDDPSRIYEGEQPPSEENSEPPQVESPESPPQQSDDQIIEQPELPPDISLSPVEQPNDSPTE